jgi:hypothetical protein
MKRFNLIDECGGRGKMERTATIHFDKIVETKSEEATLFLAEGEEVWVPNSLIIPNSITLDANKRSGEVEVQEWFAIKEGLV